MIIISYTLQVNCARSFKIRLSQEIVTFAQRGKGAYFNRYWPAGGPRSLASGGLPLHGLVSSVGTTPLSVDLKGMHLTLYT